MKLSRRPFLGLEVQDSHDMRSEDMVVICIITAPRLKNSISLLLLPFLGAK
jgi:hypothetical protein